MKKEGVEVVPGIRARFNPAYANLPARERGIQLVHESSGRVVDASNRPCSLRVAAQAAREVFKTAGVDGVKHALPAGADASAWPEDVRKAWLDARRAAMDACADAYYKTRFPPGSRHRSRDSW